VARSATTYFFVHRELARQLPDSLGKPRTTACLGVKLVAELRHTAAPVKGVSPSSRRLVKKACVSTYAELKALFGRSAKDCSCRWLPDR